VKYFLPASFSRSQVVLKKDYRIMAARQKFLAASIRFERSIAHPKLCLSLILIQQMKPAIFRKNSKMTAIAFRFKEEIRGTSGSSGLFSSLEAPIYRNFSQYAEIASQTCGKFMIGNVL
jgi:hypothetical protein